MKLRIVVALIALLELGASCASTPSAPPDAQSPSTYRGEASTATSLGAVPWRKLYNDPVLQGLIERALAKNFDVEVAYAQILEAEASLGITAANQSVFINGVAQAPYEEITQTRPPNVPSSQFSPQVGITASYQLDLFGKLASATGSARNTLLSTQEATDTVLATVVAEVATAYFQLRELDDVLVFTQRRDQGAQRKRAPDDAARAGR